MGAALEMTVVNEYWWSVTAGFMGDSGTRVGTRFRMKV